MLTMTPGPTYIHEDVRQIMARDFLNPDIDEKFYDFYFNTTRKISKIFNTVNEVLILCGEGILGLEAACASLIEKGDRVLCIDNGIFGNGFKDFVEMYGGEAVLFTCDYKNAVDVELLKEFLDKDSSFKFATLVHCETPSGITNDVSKICPLLKKHGILTVVDTVSATGGEEIKVDEYNIDIALCASQKCFSAPIGLTFLSISDDAWKIILNRKTPVPSFYCNLAAFHGWYDKKWFPYTMPVNLIYALNEATNRLLLEKTYVKRHRTIANAVRFAVLSSGLSLYAESGNSNTLTSVNVPEGIKFKEIYEEMLNDHNVMIAGSFGIFKDKLIRIGHMGENCREDRVFSCLYALDQVLRKRNILNENRLHLKFAEKI
ncbi:MAG: alanine--glyoxylate aminotransferase family protein [Oscillospiraceae bacterium]|nr:alanine--glyoxylate aminotransferase family protein [Oscillospiraceae bacterium]